MPQVSSGSPDGVPYIAVGEGPPLVLVEGLSPTSEVRTGRAEVDPVRGPDRTGASSTTAAMMLVFPAALRD